MDLINIAIARDASKRALLGARLDDPLVPDSPSLLTRARRALARTRGRRPLARSAHVDEGRAHGTVKTASAVDTKDDKRDEHLRSPDFLEVLQHPELRFESTEIRPLGEDTVEIEGDLTIRKVTNPIVLRAELHGSETDPWGNERIALEVTGTLDRSDWGMTSNQVLGSGNTLVGGVLGLHRRFAGAPESR